MGIGVEWDRFGSRICTCQPIRWLLGGCSCDAAIRDIGGLTVMSAFWEFGREKQSVSHISCRCWNLSYSVPGSGSVRSK